MHSHLMVSRANFARVAERVQHATASSLLRLSKHLEAESWPRECSAEDNNSFELLRLVNSVSSNVPGSQASKLKMRNTVLAYMSYFGIPTLYFTVNPCAQHSPVFQLMCGDIEVDLDERFPSLVPSKERAIRLAADPVAGADFYQFSVTCIFRDLFGWDFKNKCAARKGVLGNLRAFFGSDEFTNRGQLHGHFVIWLTGAPNPSVIHQQLKASEGYRKQGFSFFLTK